ncbi:hypothetical protein [Brevundimonas sp.]|uniref:Cap15 family cyclic dinucleotide receptor domain-containing protein n=1 Tax=Brevundimonas sp. TaxID=1871086 RepID=UPI0026050BF1|nr:hypothetical protein [Brevundimonas sp.]
MLHLFPVRALLTAFALIVMAAYATCLHLGIVGSNSWSETALGISKVATATAIASMLLTLVMWRWSPSFVQNLLFPYLGGVWVGEIEFTKGDQLQSRPATFEISHTLASIHCALSTVESTSQTLVVHVRRVPVVRNLVKLVYIYEVERLEGFAGAGDRYRGCAFIDVKLDKPRTMTGTYMAGQGRAGAIRLTLQSPTVWWKIWR